MGGDPGRELGTGGGPKTGVLEALASLRGPRLALSQSSLSLMRKRPLNPSTRGEGERGQPGCCSCTVSRPGGGGASALTVDVDDREGPEGEAGPAAQLASHQLDNLCDLIVALFQKSLAGA